MNEPILFCAPNPHLRPIERAPAMHAIRELGDYFRLLLWDAPEPTDYANGLRQIWQLSCTIVLIEHDHAPTVKMIQTLLACPEPVCVYPYFASAVATGNLGLPQLTASDPDERGYVEQLAVGLVKIAAPRPGMPNLVHFAEVERELAKLIGTRRHAHWPIVDHYHGLRRVKVNG